jgi:predicted  nucleic acid-binding Zn-ribbon protein
MQLNEQEGQTMNGSENKYNREYVEIKTALEHIRTKLDTLESNMRDLPVTIADLQNRIAQNQTDIAGVKTTAALFGGLAGSFFAAVMRWVFFR